jgi:hypothetical protein
MREKNQPNDYAGSAVQQVAALNEEGPDQQLIGLNWVLAGIPWGHHLLLLDKAKTV